MKLLFVCIKNSSRSQMAEALVKLSRANGFEACSVMQEIGYDLITFDFVTDLGDAVKAKCIETSDVPDPAQGDVERFRAVRDLLAHRVEALLERHHDGRQAA